MKKEWEKPQLRVINKKTLTYYDVAPEHNERMNEDGFGNVLVGFLISLAATIIIAVLCYFFHTGMKKFLIITSFVAGAIFIVWCLYLIIQTLKK